MSMFSSLSFCPVVYINNPVNHRKPMMITTAMLCHFSWNITRLSSGTIQNTMKLMAGISFAGIFLPVEADRFLKSSLNWFQMAERKNQVTRLKKNIQNPFFR